MIVFAGPSIAGTDVADTVEVRPPVQQGDVYLATLDAPRAIGIIDGYFEGVPSVWHKEILWALTQGIAVLGASSMGALRAAELDGFGMIGVGAIYEAFRSGALEDDDEVALLHGPAEMGYPTLSLAMVNLRATVSAARQASVISADEESSLIAEAKNQFYKTRTWSSVFTKTAETLLSTKRCDVLRAWVVQNDVDQKKIDAQNLLDRMFNGAFEAPKPAFHFEQTALWQEAVQRWQPRARPKHAGAQRSHRSTGGLSFLDE